MQSAIYILAVVAEICIGISSYTQAYMSEYAGDADGLIAFMNENVKEGDLLYTIEDAEGLSLSLPFYDNDLTNYETISEIDAASEEFNGIDNNIWCAVLDGYDASDADYGDYELEYVDEFAFDRYTFKMYKMIR